MSIGARIESLRKQKKLTQSELADMLHTSQSNIGHWENNRRAVSQDKLVDLADILGVSTDYLLGRDTNKASEFTTDKPDLKELLKTKAMSYGGTEISEHDLTLLEGVVRAILDKKGVTEYK